MTLSFSDPLPTQASVAALPQKGAADYPTKFEDVAPGSRVIVGGTAVQEPFEAIVLDALPEYGPTGIPAVMVAETVSGTNETFIITSSGAYTLTVLVDARDLAATLPAPKDSVKVRTRVRHADALQFKGGIESAAAIIQWAIGTTTFRYDRGTDEIGEHLVQNGLNGGTVWPGGWVLKFTDGRVIVVDDRTYAAEYEEA